jgi:hypothetical protein
MRASFLGFFAFCVSLVLLGAPRVVRAEASSQRSVFALVVTSNKSQKLTRPDLHYADDDGARYYELFRTMAPEENVTLLTSFDRDSSKLFPDLAAKVAPPEKGRVLAAFGSFARRVREAVARNERSDFYFIFAGHGDVDEGKGFLELADGKIISDELTSLVASVPATRSHVILDSCNSFFVINARKPGGKRFATAAEAGERLNRSLPNVGVFLSTSAEAETFEWSELGAGIFSHAVRSGLSGAADANGDGEVTYDELAGFVHTAAQDVKNERYRPSVFARGPSGRGGEALVDLRAAAAAKLKLPRNAARVTLRDADDLPWVDAHVEPDADVSLYVPERIAAGATIEIGSERRIIERGPDGLVLAAPAQAMKLAARGPADLFRTLFARPFGPKAFAQYRDAVASQPPPVYGVASDDVQRMNELLWHAAENARSQRRLQAVGFAAVGGAFAAVGALQLTKDHPAAAAAGAFFGIGSVPLVFAGWSALRSSREEDAFAWFSHERRKEASPDLMAGAEARLFALARRDREERLFWRWFGLVYGGLSVASQTSLAILWANDHEQSGVGTAAVTAFVTAFAIGIPVLGTFTPTYTERMAEIWARDPSRARLDTQARSNFSIKPVFGGTSIGLGGTF